MNAHQDAKIMWLIANRMTRCKFGTLIYDHIFSNVVDTKHQTRDFLRFDWRICREAFWAHMKLISRIIYQYEIWVAFYHY